MIIDAHTHIFSLDSKKYPLVAPDGSYRPITEGSAELLHAQMAEAGIDKAVTISPWFHGWDIRYTLDALHEHRSWLAVVALVEPTSTDAPQQLDRYVNEHDVCGLRIQGQISGLGRFDDPLTTPLWQKAADLGIPIDINATHEEYSQVEKRIRQFPHVPVILDHCGYISGDLSPSSPTVEPVLRMAQYSNVYAKLTFLGIPSRESYPFADVHWMARAIIDAFGAERCLYGSNFPTVQYNPLMNYRQTMQLFAEEIELTRTERSWILGGTAAKLWKWQE